MLRMFKMETKYITCWYGGYYGVASLVWAVLTMKWKGKLKMEGKNDVG